MARNPPTEYVFSSANAHSSSSDNQPFEQPSYHPISRTPSPAPSNAGGTSPLLGYSNMSGQQPQFGRTGSGTLLSPAGGMPLSRSNSQESSGSAQGMLRSQAAPRKFGPSVFPSSASTLSSGIPSRGGSPTPYATDSVNSRGGYTKGGVGAHAAMGSTGGAGSIAPTISDKFSLSADPNAWGADVSPAHAEPDDYLHNPDPKRDRKNDHGGTIFTARGLANVGCLVILMAALITLFAGYPIISHYATKATSTLGAYNLGGVNSTGQLAAVIGDFGLIDSDTPESAYTIKSMESGDTWDLVFSDEFNTEGRTFYPGDDPYWQAEDMHYWSTNNLEWYNPVNLITTNGSLQITLDKRADHGMNYSGGLMTTWNKFCFRNGYTEVSVSLPGKSDVYGLWPAIWSMGNLGRAGYGGTLDSMWPYTYNSCDVGTLANQTLDGKPEVALTEGVQWSPYNGTLSYLEGQRLSRCTCENDETHPGPKNSDGTWMGRSAPEIDLFEAQIDHSLLIGQVSQSAQWAPFNPYYTFVNNSKTYELYDEDVTALNTYAGGVYQQATSGVTTTDQNCYTAETGCFSVYGFEYQSGDDGYVTWKADDKAAWIIRGGAMVANAAAEVGQRPVPYEPMYLIMNLGISENFGTVDYDGLESLWPVTMLVDYIRVYQDPDNQMIGCDPDDMPTASYISMYSNAYNDPNITTFDQIGDDYPSRPKNKLTDTC